MIIQIFLPFPTAKTKDLSLADQMAALQVGADILTFVVLSPSLFPSSQEPSLIPQLGDASMAAPFSSKHPSILAVVQLVRQGRATLATATEMMQILALNCLLNSYR